MANNTSQHILNTAANLLGFCLIVALLLTCSCFFSFLSIRTASPVREKRLEQLADVFFVTSLVGILIVILLITCNYVG
jgi:hypothetical protein